MITFLRENMLFVVASVLLVAVIVGVPELKKIHSTNSESITQLPMGSAVATQPLPPASSTTPLPAQTKTLTKKAAPVPTAHVTARTKVPRFRGGEDDD